MNALELVRRLLALSVEERTAIGIMLTSSDTRRSLEVFAEHFRDRGKKIPDWVNVGLATTDGHDPREEALVDLFATLMTNI